MLDINHWMLKTYPFLKNGRRYVSRTGLLSSLPKRFALMQLKILSKVTVVTENENQYYRLCEEKTLVVDEKPNPVTAQFSEETFARAVSEEFQGGVMKATALPMSLKNCR